MSNEEILALAAAATADFRAMAWTSRKNGRTIEIHFVAATGGMFQMRDTLGPNVDVRPFPFTPEGIADARRAARDRAEINEM